MGALRGRYACCDHRAPARATGHLVVAVDDVSGRDGGRPLIVICRSGNRSRRAAELLTVRGAQPST
ncbi:hypothetical protein ACRJ4W_30160 [Streptomyces sp. GLT-R25]